MSIRSLLFIGFVVVVTTVLCATCGVDAGEQEEKEFSPERQLSLINEQREKAGVKPLTLSLCLIQCTQDHMDYLAQDLAYAEVTPHRSFPIRLKNFGIDPLNSYAENFLHDQLNDTQVIEDAMLNAEFRQNILNPKFNLFGAAFKVAQSGHRYYIQDFVNDNRMKTLAIVTGASRGFGVAICEQMIKKFTDIDFYLYARSVEGLKNTEQIIKQAASTSTVVSTSIDFSDLDATETLFKQSISTIDFSKYQRVLFVNNHGSLSYLGVIGEKDIDMNVTSVLITCNYFLEKVKAYIAAGNPSATTFALVNISSLAAIKAFSSWGIYCSGKAARDMMYQIIAEETKDIPAIKSLNYAPGAMDTDMQVEVREKSDPETRKRFIEMKENNKYIKTDYSAGKLVGVLEANTYESGAHIDVHDL
eukprot:gene3629-4158_t